MPGSFEFVGIHTSGNGNVYATALIGVHNTAPLEAWVLLIGLDTEFPVIPENQDFEYIGTVQVTNEHGVQDWFAYEIIEY
jgi:hypothetical protein